VNEEASVAEDVRKTIDSFHFGTYSRFPVVFERGKGVYLYDASGNVYLDFLTGISVAILGHCDDDVCRAIHDQVENLIHTSNLFYLKPQADLLKELSRTLPWKGRVFFTNSGTEAVEGAIKLARKYASENGFPGRKIISFRGGFHGRTYGALSATAREKFHAGFEPMLPGFSYVEPGDREGFLDALSGGACAVILETIQGEGGVKPIDQDFLRFVSEEVRKRGVLLICDEIQTGLGRTGKFYSFEDCGITPDIITLAKGLANGLPLGAVLAREEIAGVMTPGTHGSTFGGNPVACAAASVVVRKVREPRFLSRVMEMGEYLRAGLDDMAASSKRVTEIRGRGLMWGVVLDSPCKGIVEECLKKGLIVNCTEERVIRLLPPLILEREHVDEALKILKDVLGGD